MPGWLKHPGRAPIMKKQCDNFFKIKTIRSHFIFATGQGIECIWLGTTTDLQHFINEGYIHNLPPSAFDAKVGMQFTTKDLKLNKGKKTRCPTYESADAEFVTIRS